MGEAILPVLVVRPAGAPGEPARVRSLALRLVHGLGVLLLAGIAAFVLTRFVGDPVGGMLGEQATPADRAALRTALGLDAPLPVQFGRYLGQIAQGDLGRSLRYGRPVTALFAERLPATVDLAIVAFGLTLLLGLPLGLRLAAMPEGATRRLLDAVAAVGAALPTFTTGIVLILAFAVLLPWLPPCGRGPTTTLAGWPTGLPVAGGWAHLLLPATALAFHEGSVLGRLVETALRAALARPHVRFAQARGIAEWRLRWLHALPCALPSILPAAGMQAAQLLAYTAVTEMVFQWPGMGSLLVQSVLFGDLPVLAGYLVYVGLVFVASSALVDLALAGLERRRFEPGSTAGAA